MPHVNLVLKRAGNVLWVRFPQANSAKAEIPRAEPKAPAIAETEPSPVAGPPGPDYTGPRAAHDSIYEIPPWVSSGASEPPWW
jgi:hypothetical protein